MPIGLVTRCLVWNCPERRKLRSYRVRIRNRLCICSLDKYVETGDELAPLIAVLPKEIQSVLESQGPGELLEVVIDLGRQAEARFIGRSVPLTEQEVRSEDLNSIVKQIGAFSLDNRAGIEGTLHRISAIRNRQGNVVGLTLRVGRAIYGTIDLIRDLLVSGANLLLIGRPGVGKTTKLREMARVLADDFQKRVIVVDTSNEIGGDGDIPHPGIGSARRMQVPRPDRQHAVMIEAVENHMPEAIIVDEIGTEAEAAAARTIAERGVQLIATAHGTTLENLIMNPTLSDLVGGVHTVTLSDEEARRRKTSKTINERRAPPTFDTVVEIVHHDEVIVHLETAAAVDAILSGREPYGQRRTRGSEGEIETLPMENAASPIPLVTPVPAIPEPVLFGKPVRIYAHALSQDLLERVIRNLGIEATVVSEVELADVVLALKARASDRRLVSALDSRRIPLHEVKKNNSTQMRRKIQDIFSVVEGQDSEEIREAMQETEYAIHRVMSERVEVALAPRIPPLRRMQHRIVSRYHLDSRSAGKEPLRHLVISPGPTIGGRAKISRFG